MSHPAHAANVAAKGQRVLAWLDEWRPGMTVAKLDALDDDQWYQIGLLAKEYSTPEESRAAVRGHLAAREALPADTFADLPFSQDRPACDAVPAAGSAASAGTAPFSVAAPPAAETAPEGTAASAGPAAAASTVGGDPDGPRGPRSDTGWRQRAAGIERRTVDGFEGRLFVKGGCVAWVLYREPAGPTVCGGEMSTACGAETARGWARAACDAALAAATWEPS